MKATHPIRNHKQYVDWGLAPIAILIVSLGTLASELFAQGGPSRLSTRDLSSENAVSTNQLLMPRKALQTVQRARNYLVAGRIDQAQKEVTRALDISSHCALALHL